MVLDFFANTEHIDDTVNLNYVNKFIDDILNGVNSTEIRKKISYHGSEYDGYKELFKIVKGDSNYDYQVNQITAKNMYDDNKNFIGKVRAYVCITGSKIIFHSIAELLTGAQKSYIGGVENFCRTAAHHPHT